MRRLVLADRPFTRACPPAVRVLVASALLAVVVGGSACRDAGPSRPLAEVNGTLITVEDFEQTYVTALLNTGRNDTPGHRYRHLNNLIDAYLLAEEARARGLGADSAFQAYAERERQKALATRFYEEAFLRTLPDPTDEEIRQAFTNWQRQVVVRHLFFRTEEEARASYRRLERGRPFLDEAQDVYGLARYDSTAGFLGPIRYFSTDDAFAEVAFSLEPGTYSEPVRSRHGWHIIRVEDVIRNPLLTESEYQTRRAGIAGRERLRRRRLEGDAFVRAYLEELDVQVEVPAVNALQQVLAELENTAEGAVRGVQVQAALGGEAAAALAPETVLATYEQDGTRQTFTAADYLFWLDTLPFPEARHRTGASVGRALRNHVLAEAGDTAGLSDDPEVGRLAERAARTRLALMLRAALRNATAPDDETLLREAYERFGYADSARVQADYLVAPFPTRPEADALKARLDAGTVAFDAAPGVERFDGDVLATPSPYHQAVLRAPLGTVVLIGLADGRWALVRVDRRDRTALDFETAREEVVREVGPYLNEVALVRQLRAEARLRLDTLRFEQMYDLD